ncbi:MAG: hypothetical protein V4631_09820 [Pseudomonadota bacterium]
MSHSWPAYRNIWCHAVYGDRKDWVTGWTFIALFATGISVVLSLFSVFDSGRMVSPIPLAALAMFFWMRFVSGAVRQNTPANAQLVPGLHRNVRRVAVLAWCVTLAPVALVASAFTHASLMFLALTAIATAQGLARGGRPVGTLIFFLVVISVLRVGDKPTLLAWLSTPMVFAVRCLANLALAWEALRTVFPAGGEAQVFVQSALMGAGILALFLVRDNLMMWITLALLMLAGAFAIVSGRWKNMVNAPVQFPAERFA